MTGAIARWLEDAGFRDTARDASLAAFGRVTAHYAAAFGDTAGASAWWIPGRIEVLGKHTDYGGGRSLVCPVERGLHLLARPRADGVVRLCDASSGARWTASMRPDLHPAPGDWFDYPLTVVRRLARDFPGLSTGMDAVFLSTIPRAAGLSSSSALIIATFLPLAAANRLAGRDEWRAALPDQAALAGYLGAVENGLAFGPMAGDFGVGTHGGSEDHTAILCGVAGHLSCYRYLPVTHERTVPLPADWTFAIASSGVQAPKAGAVRAHYNALSLQLRELLAHWRRGTGSTAPSLLAALGEAPDAAARLGALVGAATAGEPLRRRLEQFVEECDRIIPGVLDAMARGDGATVGGLVDRSQALAEEVLANQIDETVWLARAARDRGAIAASAFGAGFGGSVWALIRADDAASFLQEWRDGYRTRYPERTARSDFFLSRPGPGAARLGPSD